MHAVHPFPFGVLPLAPVHADCRLIVTIPAKDEAEFIEETLDALRVQYDINHCRLPHDAYEVIVLANNCSDDTADVIRRYGRRHPTFRLHVEERQLPKTIACVGTARRWMMDTAYARLSTLGRRDAVICSSDADTLVAPDWVAQILRAVAEGAQAVGGRILVPAGDGRAGEYRKQHLQDVTYRSLQYCLESMIDPCDADPWPRHFQHFGPSTAVTVAAYEKCGGLPPLKCLEDVNFVLALERVDIPVTHDCRVRVRTSSRVSNRVEGTAFSHQLDEWAEMERKAQDQHVVSFTNCLRLFKWKVALRHAYRQRNGRLNPVLLRMVDAIGCSAEELREKIMSATSFGELYQPVRRQIELDPAWNNQPISQAIRELRTFTKSMRKQAAGIRRAGSVPRGQTVRA